MILSSASWVGSGRAARAGRRESWRWLARSRRRLVAMIIAALIIALGSDAAGAGRGPGVAANGRRGDPDRTPAGHRSTPRRHPQPPPRSGPYGDVAAGPTPGRLPDRRARRARYAGPGLGLRRPAGRVDGLGLGSRPSCISTSSTARCPGCSSSRLASRRDVHRRRAGGTRCGSPSRTRSSTSTRGRRTHRAGADGRPVPGLATDGRRAEVTLRLEGQLTMAERSRSPSPSAESVVTPGSARPLAQQLPGQQRAAGGGDREDDRAGERDGEQQEDRDRRSPRTRDRRRRSAVRRSASRSSPRRSKAEPISSMAEHPAAEDRRDHRHDRLAHHRDEPETEQQQRHRGRTTAISADRLPQAATDPAGQRFIELRHLAELALATLRKLVVQRGSEGQRQGR